MEVLKCKDRLWRPCGMDILEFSVIGVRQYEDHVMYELKADHGVGAQGRIEILVCHRGEHIRFVDYLDAEHSDRSITDWFDGEYYPDQRKARIAFYDVQVQLIRSSVEQAERILKERRTSLAHVEKILTTIKEDLKGDPKQ